LLGWPDTFVTDYIALTPLQADAFDCVDPAPARAVGTTVAIVSIDDVPAATLHAYPKATVVAEKLHAVTVLGMTNTRMKDFFDLALLLRDDTLDDAELQRAIEATFARRQTAMPSATPIGLSDAFASDTTKQTQWRAFLNKNKLAPTDLRDGIGAVRVRATQFGFPRE
jgi:hypothetical protein